MNFDVHFRSELSRVSQFIVEELDRLYAGIATFWNTEHTEDGGHGNIFPRSCTSLAGYTERGRSKKMGEWTRADFAAANFTGSGGMTWTPDSGDLNFAYALIGKAFVFRLWIRTSTVSGGAQDLIMTLPPGFRVASDAAGAGVCQDNGGNEEGMFWFTTATAQTLTFRRLGGANWGAAVNTTYLYAQGAFEISEEP